MNSVLIAIEKQALLVSIDFLTFDTALALHPSLSVSLVDSSVIVHFFLFM